MTIGDLRSRIDIKTGPSVDPVTRYPVEGGVLVYSCWSAVSAVKGREYFAAAAIHAENTVSFTIRQKSGLDTTMKVFFDNRTFDIKSILPDYEDKKFMVLMCTEVI